jgi:uncharacterized membrane protein YccC
VTVGILALQTRGQAYQKAVYRILCTIIGVVASFAIAGLFAQSRELFVLAFAGWLGLCVYVGGFLDGNRAYGAVLAGYTVALVAVTQIDSPASIFDAGVNRGAAVVVGIAALALINDGFAAPNLHPGLSDRLAAAQWRVRTLARAILRGESADPIQSANLLSEITALRPDITALAAESSGGSARGAAARSAAVALVAEVSAATALASLPAAALSSLRSTLADALGGDSRALQLRLRQRADRGDAHAYDALFVRHAQDLLIEDRRAQDAIEDLRAGRDPARDIRAPIYRSRRAAVQNALRAFLAVVISAVLFSLGGWPLAAQGVALVGVTIALSANTPNPGTFAAAAVIAMPIAALLARDGVPDPRRRRSVSPARDWHGSHRARRGAAVHDSQSETGPNRAPASRLLSGDALPDQPAELQPRDLSVLQFSGDHVGDPAVRSAADSPAGVRRASAALVPDIGANGDARGPGRSPVPPPE